MEFEQIGLSFSEPTDPVSDLRPFFDLEPPPSIFSPTQSEYGCMLDAIEMELLQRSSEPPPHDEAENEEEATAMEDGGMVDEGILGGPGCKNLVSERNRRKRLNQQLLALRSLVPCISKMDKRSILMDAATYLQSLHREIKEIEQELSMQEASQGSATTSTSESSSPSSHVTLLPSLESSPTHLHISRIEIDVVDDWMFIVKVSFHKSPGAVSEVQRMIESLSLNIWQSWTHEMDGDQMITTSFINVKKQIKMTADVLKVQLSEAAFKFGLEIDVDD